MTGHIFTGQRHFYKDCAETGQRLCSDHSLRPRVSNRCNNNGDLEKHQTTGDLKDLRMMRIDANDANAAMARHVESSEEEDDESSEKADMYW